MKSIIYQKLSNYFKPEVLEVINESDKHSNHSASPNTGNSHFFVKIKSKRFEKKKLIESHKMIYKTLDSEMKEFIHALRIEIMK